MRVRSSREFNQDVRQAKRVARRKPVFVTDRGKPTHVLMGIDAFRQMSGQVETMVDLLALPGLGEVDPELRADPVWSRDGTPR